MIQYSPITLEEAVNEVLLRLGQFRTATNLDRQTVELFVNKSRREVLIKTLPYKDWGYITHVPIQHLGVQGQAGGVPRNFIRMVRVVLNGLGLNAEARYADPREFFTLSDIRSGQRWNQATYRNPVYTLWGGDYTTTRGLVFYAAPFATYIPAVGAIAQVGVSNLSGTAECYCGYDDVTQPTDRLRIPAEFENLVVTGAVARCLQKLGETARLVEVQKKSMDEQMRLRSLFAEKTETERIGLESRGDEPMKLGAQ